MTNPLTLLKFYRQCSRLIRLCQEATASYERTQMFSKSMFASKTFWINTIGVALEIAQLVSGLRVVPSQYMALILGVLNVVMRSLTNQPVHFVAPK